MKLCCFAFLQGGPNVLSKFPPESQKTNPIWIGYMDFIGFWRLSGVCSWFVFFCICAWGAGYLANFVRKVRKQIQFEMGTWISYGCWSCFLILFLNLFLHFWRGGRVLSKFPPRNKKTNQIWIGCMYFIWFWKPVWECYLWNSFCIVAGGAA